MALLEASAIGLPIVARDIPALAGCPSDALAKSAADVAAKVMQLCDSGPEARQENVARWREYFSSNTGGEQRARLLTVYGPEGVKSDV